MSDGKSVPKVRDSPSSAPYCADCHEYETQLLMFSDSRVNAFADIQNQYHDSLLRQSEAFHQQLEGINLKFLSLREELSAAREAAEELRRERDQIKCNSTSARSYRQAPVFTKRHKERKGGGADRGAVVTAVDREQCGSCTGVQAGGCAGCDGSG
ncbi:MAG: uncharacterized protein KVP18_005040 [Porospora cf. gigantea A]|uniref:uncharacterized protein n=1 Tax=Porospora cf. gigantea A TaxID=2853593 RepID=UPI00355AA7A2|nr:MAG: hypothetical protein KVP18_005040 [Porospora cf. gigantea A]